MAEHQGPRRHASCLIMVDGNDVTSRVDPYLISVKVVDTLEGDFDTCSLELDDRNAQLQIPQDESKLQVYLGWANVGPRPFMGTLPASQRQSELEGLADEGVTSSNPLIKEMAFNGPGMEEVFNGIITQVESGFTRRGGGRRLWIEATSNNNKGKAKEVQNVTQGKGQEDDAASFAQRFAGDGGQKGTDGGGGGDIPLEDVMTKVFGFAGLQVAMSPEMKKHKRDFWHVNESANNFGQRMAAELGGYFKVANGKAILFGKDEDMGLGTADAVWGVNLIGWRIKPFSGRAQYAQAASKFFDLHKGAWEGIQKSIGGNMPFGNASAAMNFIQPVANKVQGEQNNGGGSADSESRRGNGWVLMNGDPRVKAGATLEIDGARPGVDGTYRVTEVEHNYQRGVGFTTRCNVAQPKPKNGFESWKKKPGDNTPNFDQRFKGLPEGQDAEPVVVPPSKDRIES